MNIRPFFADDIFISYARKDSSTYASGLADELTRRGFSCFIDRLGTEANRELPGSLRRKVRGCAMLVVVGTRWSGTRDSIKDEIVEFNKTKRPIVPIDIDGSIHDASWYQHIEGIAPEPEKNLNALDDGNPTPAVISRIEKAFHYKRRNERLRRWTIATAALLVLLVALSAYAARTARNELANARHATAEAVTAKGQADKAKGEAEKARQDAVAARVEADQARADAEVAKSDAALAKTAAETATRKAEEQTQLAQAATIRAQDAAANADKQHAIAVGRQTATVAGSRRARSQRLQDGWADMLQHSVLLAVEADKRLSTRGIPPAESQQALRDSLDLLPRAVQRFEHAHGVKAAILTTDGKYLITKEDDGFMRVWESASHKQISEVKLEGEVTFNADRTLMAMGSKSGQASVWRLPQAEQLCKGEWTEAELCKEQSAKYSSLKFSSDGKYLAADVTTPGSSGSDNPSRSIVVWDMRNGQRVTEVKYDGNLKSLALDPEGDLLALSLTRSKQTEAARDPKRRPEDEPQGDNLLQIWKVKSPVAELVREAVMQPKSTARGCRNQLAYLPLFDLSFSPDGKLIAANTGYHASILEVSTAQEVTYVLGPNRDPIEVKKKGLGQGCSTEGIVQVEFSRDGRSISTIGDEGALQTWDVATGRNIWQEIPGDVHPSDWKRPYAVLNNEGGMRIVDVRTGKDVARVLHELVVAADYTPEADRLVFFNGTNVWLLDTGSAQEAGRVAYGGSARIDESNITPDSRYVAVTDGARVVVWDAINARQISRLEHGSRVREYVAFSPDGAHIATATWDDKTLHLWETGTGRKVWQITDLPLTMIDMDNDEQWNVTSLYFSPAGKFLVLEVWESDDAEGSIQIWEVNSKRKIATTQRSEVFNRSLEKGEVFFTSDDKFVVLHGGDNVRVLDTSNHTVVTTLPQEEGTGRALLSPDNRVLARSRGGTVEILKLLGGSELHKIQLGGEEPTYVFSNDGKYLVAFGGEGWKRGVVIEIATGRRVDLSVDKRLASVKFSTNGRYLVTESETGEENRSEVNFWEVASGHKLPSYANEGLVGGVVFSTDERRVAIFASKAQTVYVLNPTTGRKEKLDHDGPVQKVTFSPDGEYIAAISGELVHVWEVSTSREMARLRHDGKVLSMRFVGGRHQLATVSDDLVARVWILEEDKLVQRACERLTRNLRPDEWQRAFSGEKQGLTCPNLPVASVEHTTEEP